MRWFRVAVREMSPAPEAFTTYSRGTSVGKPSGLIGHSGQFPLAEGVDMRYLLRGLMKVVGDGPEVVLDYTDLVQGASYEEADDPRKMALELPAVNYPSDETITVLTEGCSDRVCSGEHFERALPALQRSLLSTRLDYDYFSCLPGWAKQTLKEHQEDEREHLYTREKL